MSAPTRIGRYEVQRRLGAGGMGALYLARDPQLDRLVAIKLLKEELQDDSGLRERFIREARSVARLRHGNIVIVFDVGEDKGRPFMAMEYIAGETLGHVLRRRPSVPVTRRLQFVEDLCAGLAHAHGAGIIHRDIKPANLMLDGDGVLKILDFGIARLGNSGMTQEGMMMGTVNYMSPEQVTGRGVDHRTDIFAAGAVLYEAVSLEQAFPGRIDTGVLHRILTEGPVPLNTLVPAIDAELLGIVQRALDRDPAQRYQDANVMRRDIQRVRRRLMDQGGAVFDSGVTTAIGEEKPPSGAVRRPDSDRPRRLNPERFAELQRQQVAEHLRYGEEAFARGDHDAALQHAERAATVDPDSRAAFDLIDRARFASESKAVRQLLSQARRLLDDGQLEEAAALADEASVTFPDVQGAAELRTEVRQIVERVTAAREREERIVGSLDRARASIERGGYETALRAVYEVLSLDPDRAEARALEQQAQAGLQAQREHERARRSAHEQITRARTLASEGKYNEAVRAIEVVVPPSDTVRVAAAEALAAVRAAQKQAMVAAVVARARDAIDRGQFAEAVAAVDSIPAEDQTRETKGLREAAERSLREQRELERKRAALESAIATVNDLIERGELGPAQERLTAAWTIGLIDERLPALGSRIRHLAAEAEARRQQQIRDRLAAKRVEAARQLLANGDGYAAVTLLERDGSGHPLVEAALKEIRAAIAEQEERVRQEAERRRQEEEARRRVEAEAARKLEEQRKADEQRRRIEEERARREAERQRRRDEVATLLVDAERAMAADRPDEATVLLTRADERVESAEDTELRRRVAEMKASAAQHARQRLEDARRQEEEARRREKALDDLLTRAYTTPAHEDALTILNEALTLAPGDTRVQQRVDERREALERQRLDEARAREAEERARAEAQRLAELEAARVREEQRRAAEAERLAKEEHERQDARRREEEARRAKALDELLARAHTAPVHEEALTILNEALTIAPGDTRVQQHLHERREALEQQRLAEARAREAEERAREEARRAAQLEAERLAKEEQQRQDARRREEEARRRAEDAERARQEAERAREEAARLERERQAQRERDAQAAAVVDEARTLFSTGQHDEALTVLRASPIHALTQTAVKELEARKAEIQREREREVQRKQQEERRAARAAAINSAVRDRRVHVAAATLVGVSVVWAAWQFWPPSAPEVAVNVPSAVPAPIAPTEPAPQPPAPAPTTPSIPAPTAKPQPANEPTPPGGARGGGALTGTTTPNTGGRATASPNQPVTTTPPAVTQPPPPAGSAATPPAPVQTPPAVEPPVVTPQPQQQPQPQPQQPPVAPPVTTPPTAQAAPRIDLAAERAAIQQIISRYASAYARMDEGELRRIDPGFTSIPSRVLLKSVELTPSGIAIDVDPSGQSATVRFTQNFRYEWNRARMPPTARGDVSWNMRKVGSDWRVVR